MTITGLNAADRRSFIDSLGWIFEHSPWVAERAWNLRPFADRQALHGAMVNVVDTADADEQLALIRAHPDLGTRARMSDASMGEQAGAGLDQLTADEFHSLTTMNTAYRSRFGFPFIYAVKGATKHDILRALAARLENDPDAERVTALQQIARIGGFRLSDVVEDA